MSRLCALDVTLFGCCYLKLPNGIRCLAVLLLIPLLSPETLLWLVLKPSPQEPEAKEGGKKEAKKEQ